MISVVVFSKDRPLQLHGYLDSLRNYANQPLDVSVLYKETSGISYDLVRHNFPWVFWVKETNFYQDVRRLLNNAGDLVLWGCDDVCFKGYIDVPVVEHCFDDPKMLYFSLRYGRNLLGWDKVFERSLIKEENGVIVFDTRRADAYPWDVSAAVYRRTDIDTMLSVNATIDAEANQMMPIEYPVGTVLPIPQVITGPNMLEWTVFYWFGKQIPAGWDKPYAACFSTSRSLSFSVNRVQDVCPNVYDSTPATQEVALYQAYLAGRRLNWQGLHNWSNRYTHEGAARFEVI